MTSHTRPLETKIVVHVETHQSTAAGADQSVKLHMSPGRCNAMTSTGLQLLQVSTLDAELNTGRRPRLCGDKACHADLSSATLSYLYDITHQIKKTTRELDEVRTYPLRALQGMVEARRSLSTGPRTSPSGERSRMGQYVQLLEDQVKSNLRVTLKELKDKTVLDVLYTTVLNDGTKAMNNIECDLQLTALGKTTDEGIMVGPVTPPGNNVLLSTWMEVLPSTISNTKALTRAPMGVLMNLISYGRTLRESGSPGHLGDHDWQVMPTPAGLDLDLTDTILGLYEPGSSGIMGQLPDVVQAARMVHQARA